MLSLLTARRSRAASDPRGQVMVIFAFAFVVIILRMALRFDGGRGLLLRREMKNASDAAAMAGANVLMSLNPTGCSLTASPPGAPRAEVVAAVQASVAANLPAYNPANITTRCGLGNTIVRVELSDQSPTFFGSVFLGVGPTYFRSTGTSRQAMTVIP